MTLSHGSTNVSHVTPNASGELGKEVMDVIEGHRVGATGVVSTGAGTTSAGSAVKLKSGLWHVCGDSGCSQSSTGGLSITEGVDMTDLTDDWRGVSGSNTKFVSNSSGNLSLADGRKNSSDEADTERANGSTGGSGGNSCSTFIWPLGFAGDAGSTSTGFASDAGCCSSSDREGKDATDCSRRGVVS